MISTTGPALEARLQRLFLAQGILAERGLKVVADKSRERTATDIDVLISEYGSGFHLTRRHVECKGGKVHPLDRILWMRGVRELLAADSSYFVVGESDPEVAFFARQLQIDMWTLRHIEQMESALKIPADSWPCRSNFGPYASAREIWAQMERGEPGNSWWPFFKEVLRYVELDSWMAPSYTRLNRLLRYVNSIGEFNRGGDLRRAEAVGASRYGLSALLVRLAQYLIFVCYDVSVLQRSDIPAYLAGRLTFGDHDPEQSRDLLEGGLRLARASVEAAGQRMPSLDTSRLMSPPPWTDTFNALVFRLLDGSNEVRYLPVATEALQFDTEDSIKKFQRLSSAVKAGAELAALVKGFLVQAYGLPQAILEPLPAVMVGGPPRLAKDREQIELAVGQPPAASTERRRRR